MPIPLNGMCAYMNVGTYVLYNIIGMNQQYTRSAGSRYDSLGKKYLVRCARNALGLAELQRDREVEKRSIKSLQELSDYAVDWFLVSPGLTLRGLDLCRKG